jgi:alpha-galactosidase
VGSAIFARNLLGDIFSAAMLDPHTAAELDLDQIWPLVDELIAAHCDWLPAYE